MAITAEQDQELSELLEALEPEMKRFNDWEKNFVQDQINRHQQHGSNIFMSPRQWEVLRKIHSEKVGEPVPETGDPDDWRGEMDDEIPF